MFNIRAAARFARLRSVPRQPKPQRKEHQEKYRSSLPFSFSPCSLIKSTKTVSEMLARRETRRRAENPLAAKKQFVRYSHPIVSQNQTKPGGAKNAVCSSNRKKSKCLLSRSVTDSYVDMRIRQPDSSDGAYYHALSRIYRAANRDA